MNKSTNKSRQFFFKSSILFVVFFAVKATSENKKEKTLLDEDPITLLECNSSCNCQWKTSALILDKEYIIECSGTGLKKALANDLLFEGQSEPQHDEIVHVSMLNFSRLTIDPSFLSRWLEYKTSSMELNSTRAVFPTVIPTSPLSDTTFARYSTGIGMVNSSVSFFPSNLYEGKDESKLMIYDSFIEELNLGALLGNNDNGFSSFQVKNSTIEVLKSPQQAKLDAPNNIFEIEDSKIGILETGAFVFNNSEIMKAPVAIKNTSFGIVKSGAIDTKNIVLDISDSSFDILEKSAIKLDKNGVFNITHNYLNLLSDSFVGEDCIFNQIIEGNYYFPLDNEKQCILNPDENGCGDEILAEVYIDPTCGENILLRLRPLPVPKKPKKQPKSYYPLFCFWCQ